MIGDTHLPADHHVVFNDGRSCHAGLRRNQCSLANLHVVRQVYEVIELCLRAQAGNAQRTPGNRRVRADFHVVSDLQVADLRKFPMLALIGYIPESVTPEDRARMYGDVAADLDAGIKRHAGIQPATVSEQRASSHKAERSDLRAFTDFNFFLDHRKGTHGLRPGSGAPILR